MNSLSIRGFIFSTAILALGGCAAQGDGSRAQPNFKEAFNAFGAALNKPAGGQAMEQPGLTDQQGSQLGKMAAISAQNVMVEAPRPADPRWTGKRIADTALAGLFTNRPISRPGDYWPRVSIRMLDYSETLAASQNIQYLRQQPGSVSPNMARPPECIKFDAVIWFSDKKSQKVDGVVLCNGDLKFDGDRLTIGAMRNYRNLMAPVSISSEQLRTAGPRVPAKLIPLETPEAISLYQNGGYLFGELFLQMGYRGPLDGDQRLWFVNLANK